jgi:hypothetical protein
VQHTAFLRTVIRAPGQNDIVLSGQAEAPSALRLGANVTFSQSATGADVGSNEANGTQSEVFASPPISIAVLGGGDAVYDSAALAEAPQGRFLSLHHPEFLTLQEVCWVPSRCPLSPALPPYHRVLFAVILPCCDRRQPCQILRQLHSSQETPLFARPQLCS